MNLITKRICCGLSIVAISITLNQVIIAKDNEISVNTEVYNKVIPSMDMQSLYTTTVTVPNAELYGKPYSDLNAMYADLRDNQTDWDGKRNRTLDALARCIFGELNTPKTSDIKTDGVRGRQAIIWVIINRKLSGKTDYVESGKAFTYRNIIFANLSKAGGKQFIAMHTVVDGGAARPLANQNANSKAAWNEALQYAYLITTDMRISIPNPCDVKTYKNFQKGEPTQKPKQLIGYHWFYTY